MERRHLPACARSTTFRAVDSPPVQLDIYRTAIPMRRFEHAAARRDASEAIVVAITLVDGTVGWGETLPRDYVTGETLDTVPRDIEAVLWPVAKTCDPQGEGLPLSAGDRPIPAARCAVELARRDAWNRLNRTNVLCCGVAGPPAAPARVSGVLGSSDSARTAWRIRLMRWYGLRDFKLKLGLGDDIDEANLRTVADRLGRAIRRGRCTLRVDVNGGWSAEETPARVAELKPLGVCVVEQPVFAPAAELADLADRCELPLMADESLVTEADARTLLSAKGRVWLNVRLSKNGGLWPTLRIAALAAEAGVPYTLGCMVGESSILSAAQREMLAIAPPPRFVEGNYGRLLLADDLARTSLRFGYGGRLGEAPARPVRIDPKKLARYARLVKSLRAGLSA